jgi:hypothetical protein
LNLLQRRASRHRESAARSRQRGRRAITWLSLPDSRDLPSRSAELVSPNCSPIRRDLRSRSTTPARWACRAHRRPRRRCTTQICGCESGEKLACIWLPWEPTSRTGLEGSPPRCQTVRHSRARGTRPWTSRTASASRRSAQGTRDEGDTALFPAHPSLA